MLNENIAKLSAEDVLLASFPNSGSSLLGGMLISLGVNYVEGYQEALQADGGSAVVDPYWRARWGALDGKGARLQAAALRVVKTHNFPDAFRASKARRVIVLVRDPRDAAISYFHWLTDFSSTSPDLATFVRESRSFFGFPPLGGWKAYAEAWAALEAPWRSIFVTYEDLKFHPLPTLARVAAFLGLAVAPQTLTAAVRENSFARARAEEDAQVARGATIFRRKVEALQRNSPDIARSDLLGPAPAGSRIFRRGLVGEWRGAFDAAVLESLMEPLQPLLEQFGLGSSTPLLPRADVVVIGASRSVEPVVLEAARSGATRIVVLDADGPGPGPAASPRHSTTPGPVAAGALCRIVAGVPGLDIRVVPGPLKPMHLDWLSGRVVVETHNAEIARSAEAACVAKGLAWRWMEPPGGISGASDATEVDGSGPAQWEAAAISAEPARPAGTSALEPSRTGANP